MFLAYGKPTDTTGWTTHEDTWEVCLSLCYYDDNCQLVYRNDTTCAFFLFGNITVQKMPRSADNLVGFKLNYTTDDCPANIDDLFSGNLTEWTADSLIYRRQLTASSTEWNVLHTVSMCPDNATLYSRSFNGRTFHVCVGVRLFPNGAVGNYSETQQLCRDNNGYGLTGPLNKDEQAIFIKEVTSIRKIEGTSYIYIWIDGVNRTNKKLQYEFDDESHNGRTGYDFAEGEPNDGPNSSALHLIFNNGIGDFWARYNTSGKHKFRGGFWRVNGIPAISNS